MSSSSWSEAASTELKRREEDRRSGHKPVGGAYSSLISLKAYVHVEHKQVTHDGESTHEDRTRTYLEAFKKEIKYYHLPYDKALVNKSVKNYFAASWVREGYGGRYWVASRGPSERSLYNLLSMLLSDEDRPAEMNNSYPMRTIVQLNGYDGTADDTIFYLPKEGTKELVKPKRTGTEIYMEVVSQTTMDDMDCIESKVILAQGEKKVNITHLLINTWKDGEAPDDIKKLIRLIEYIHQINKGEDGQDVPALVHCQAGIGRTGTFIAASSLIRNPCLGSQSTPLSYKSELESNTLYEKNYGRWVYEIDFLREQRAGMVLSQKQEEFVASVDEELQRRR